MNCTIKKAVHFFIDEELLKHTSIMFTASIIGSACNYLFQLYMGRALGPVDYGIFGSLFAISYMISILTATIQTSAARFISKFTGENAQNKIKYFLKKLMKRMFILGIFLAVIIIGTSSFISSFLNIGSIIPIIILGSYFLFSTILPVNLGALQGLQKFIPLGLNDILNFSMKLVFGVILVFIGYGVNGAIGAIVIGSVIALMMSFVYLKPYLSKGTGTNNDFHFLELYRYSFPTLIAMFCFTVPANIDLIIAKHVFDGHTAGLYAAVTVLGKIILFIPGAISIVMFPMISKLDAEKKRTSDILFKSLLYTIVLSGFFTMIYWLFPSAVVKIPYGIAYIQASSILQLYGLTMFFFSLTVVLMRYCLAIHNIRYVYLFSFFTILEIILLIFFNSSMAEMVTIMLAVNCILFFCSLLYVLLFLKSEKTKKGVFYNG